MNLKPRISSYREVLLLAWPVILSNLSVPLLGAVDTAVIGHLPNPAFLGAVAIGAMIFSFLYWGFSFLRMGTTGFISQASGAGDVDEIRAIVARALILGGIAATAILLFHSPIISIATQFIETTDAVKAGATEYFNYRIWGAPAALANYCLLGIFIGLGNTRAALITQVSMNAMNIILDLIFVLGLDMDVAGVALATAISEYLAVAIGGFLVWRELAKLGGKWRKDEILSFSKMKQLLSVNRDIFVRTVTIIFAFAYFTASAAKQGEETLAAVAVAMNFMHFMSFGLDGFAHAAESMVGKAIGARQADRLNEVVSASTVLAVAVSLLYAAIYWLFGESIVNTLTSIEPVREIAYSYLPWLTVMPLFAVWSFQLDGIFVGAMRAKEMRNGMLISFGVYYLCIQLLQEKWGADGLWISMIIFMIARGVTLAVVYPRVKKLAMT
ncbi:MAG: MATE family efflux transporter [Sneathiella sp.]